MLQSVRSPVLVPMKSLKFSDVSNHSIHTVAQECTQPLGKMNTTNISGSKERPAPKADNLTAIRTDCVDNVRSSTVVR
jgi:hypothetical protein